MTEFEKIQTYIERAQKLRRRAEEALRLGKIDQGYEDDPRILPGAASRAAHARALASACEKRAKHVLWDAKHEAYNKARRNNNPPYRKRFSKPAHV